MVTAAQPLTPRLRHHPSPVLFGVGQGGRPARVAYDQRHRSDEGAGHQREALPGEVGGDQLVDAGPVRSDQQVPGGAQFGEDPSSTGRRVGRSAVSARRGVGRESSCAASRRSPGPQVLSASLRNFPLTWWTRCRVVFACSDTPTRIALVLKVLLMVARAVHADAARMTAALRGRVLTTPRVVQARRAAVRSHGGGHV